MQYRGLVRYTKKTLQYINNAKIAGLVKQTPDWTCWCLEVDHTLPLIDKVIDQTTRRVFNDETVPASEKIFSLFETHTDIIIKGSRDIQYGHKLNFSTGRSGMVLDVVIESGNLLIRISSSPWLIDILNIMVRHPGKPQRMVVMPVKKIWKLPNNEILKMSPSIRKED